MKFIVLVISFMLPCMLYGQLENKKEVLVRNAVKSEIEQTCTGSCSAQYSEYDKRGNLIEWNFFRLGSICKYLYDDSDNELMALWINKLDTSKIDTLYRTEEHQNYVENYDAALRQLTKKGDNERIIITYDKRNNPIEERKFVKGALVYTESIKYDIKGRLDEKRIVNMDALESINYNRDRIGKQPLLALVEQFKYNDDDQIIELYTYFSDPCMSLDNHFRYVYTYYENGLIKEAEVYEEGLDLAFTLEYEYEFYEK